MAHIRVPTCLDDRCPEFAEMTLLIQAWGMSPATEAVQSVEFASFCLLSTGLAPNIEIKNCKSNKPIPLLGEFVQVMTVYRTGIPQKAGMAAFVKVSRTPVIDELDAFSAVGVREAPRDGIAVWISCDAALLYGD